MTREWKEPRRRLRLELEWAGTMDDLGRIDHLCFGGAVLGTVEARAGRWSAYVMSRVDEGDGDPRETELRLIVGGLGRGAARSRLERVVRAQMQRVLKTPMPAKQRRSKRKAAR